MTGGKCSLLYARLFRLQSRVILSLHPRPNLNIMLFMRIRSASTKDGFTASLSRFSIALSCMWLAASRYLELQLRIVDGGCSRNFILSLLQLC